MFIKIIEKVSSVLFVFDYELKDLVKVRKLSENCTRKRTNLVLDLIEDLSMNF